jgi:fructosamine-3-kinase
MIQNIPLNVRKGVIGILNLKGVDALLDFNYSGGGCINSGGKLKTTAGTFFVKWNSAKKFPYMFESEAKGLKMLRKEKAIAIPDVVAVGQDDDSQFILLEFIDQAPQSKSYWIDLGCRLATIHKATDAHFGLDHDNYMGSLAQFNRVNDSWIDFFINQRLRVQLKLAMDSGLAESQMIKSFESLYMKLKSLLPQEKPALVHGDLWSGNIITTHKGEPCLIDPAVHYGCREIDLAMTKLFGSFPTEFYDAYNNTFPLIPGYEGRFDLYNLYPLLVHLNLFGTQYMSPIVATLSRFV